MKEDSKNKKPLNKKAKISIFIFSGILITIAVAITVFVLIEDLSKSNAEKTVEKLIAKIDKEKYDEAYDDLFTDELKNTTTKAAFQERFRRANIKNCKFISDDKKAEEQITGKLTCDGKTQTATFLVAPENKIKAYNIRE